MLIKVKSLKGYKLHGRDGEIGHVDELYFDDKHWAIRYLIAETGNWLTGKQVLISPYALFAVNTDEENIAVNLTKKQIEECPSLDTDKPVSRQYEDDYYKYYGWPIYWDGPYMWGPSPSIVRDHEKWAQFSKSDKVWDPHLRSSYEVSGYYIQAEDGEIGHVEDFVIDDETWAIRYLIIDTENWLPGKKVLVSPQWINEISWSESKVFINLTREIIMQSPEYSDDSLLTRDYETGLFRHYNRKGYWINELGKR